MRFRAKRFYRSKKDFEGFYFGLKQTICPHCGYIGALILHGYLYGYDERIYGKRIVRGRRVFCSNRKRRKGCGKTFSILKAAILKGFNVSANSLWRFLRNIRKGISKIQAFRLLKLSFSNSTVYRLWNKFSTRQSRLRTLLIKQCAPPKLPDRHNPAIQTILHLKNAFKTVSCPIFAFQECFQIPFL